MTFKLWSVLIVAAFIPELTSGVLIPSDATKFLHTDGHIAYQTHLLEYGNRDTETDTVPYATRLALFEQRAALVAAHNARADVSWKMGLNEFSDYTDAEQNAMLFGYLRSPARWNEMARPAGLLETSSSLVGEYDSDYDSSNLPAVEIDPTSNEIERDWRKNAVVTASDFRNQGKCGSCWAVAVVGVLEMRAEIKGLKIDKLSHVALVNCVPNPKHCGGTGGCHGATPAIAFDYIQEFGVPAQSDSAVGKYGNVCPEDEKNRAIIGITGTHQLPVNKLQPLLQELYNEGPVAVSADASHWHGYHSGVFHNCSMNPVANHAIVATGFGYDKTLEKKYWTIRNSWGTKWGDGGYIRIERHESDELDAGYCGIDNHPEKGGYCENGPNIVPVCGMCAILSDSVAPLGLHAV